MTGLTLNLALISLIGGLLSLDRRAAMQLMLSQPLVAVSLLGVIMGYPDYGVLLGCLLQLIWMSCVLFGANVPRNDTLASVTIGGVCFLYAIHVHPLDSATWTLAILLGVPVCVLGQWMDIKLDHLNLGLAAKADQAALEGNTRAISFCVFQAILRIFLVNATAVAVTTAALLYLLVIIRNRLDASSLNALGIIGVYLIPALGIAVALSLLRHRRGLALAAIAFVIVSTVIAQGQLQ